MNVTDSTVAGVSRHYVYSGNQLQRMETSDQQTVLARYFYDLDGNLSCVTDAGGSEANCPSPYGAAPPTHLLETYKWDFLGRLQHYQRYGQSAVEASYEYDALDRMVREWTKVGTTERTNCFSYLGLSGAVSDETRVPSVGATPCAETPTFTKGYAYDADLERTAVNVSGSGPESGDFYFGRNVHGDVSLLLKNDGSRKATYGYLPYGQDDPALDGGESTDPNEPFNPYRFNDRRLDPASASEQMGARRYSGGLGRFLQQDFYPGAEDDLGLTLDSLNANRYAFAAGNPLNLTDLTGHEVYASGADARYFRKHMKVDGSSSSSSGGSGSTQGASTATRTTQSWRNYWRDYNFLHQQAIAATVGQIQEQVPGALLGLNLTVEGQNYIPGAGRGGGPGYADIILRTGGVTQVWEVKPDTPSGRQKGPPTLQRYIAGLMRQGDRAARPGQPLADRYRMIGIGGTGAAMRVRSGLGPVQSGLEFYSLGPQPRIPAPREVPGAEPAPTEQPRSGFHLGFDPKAGLAGGILADTIALRILVPETNLVPVPVP